MKWDPLNIWWLPFFENQDLSFAFRLNTLFLFSAKSREFFNWLRYCRHAILNIYQIWYLFYFRTDYYIGHRISEAIWKWLNENTICLKWLKCWEWSISLCGTGYSQVRPFQSQNIGTASVGITPRRSFRSWCGCTDVNKTSHQTCDYLVARNSQHLLATGDVLYISNFAINSQH